MKSLSSEESSSIYYKCNPSSSNITDHLLWISRIISRIASNSTSKCIKKSTIDNLPISTIPILNLSFIPQSTFIRFADFFNSTSIEPINLSTLSTGTYYSIIATIFTNGVFTLDLTSSTSNKFDLIFKCLSSIGYKPCQPCTQFGLMAGLPEHHSNLCESLEYVVIEKSLSCEIFLDDLRKVPRSFFVLRDGWYPSTINEAIGLWLSKFPCIVNLPEIEDTSIENLKHQFCYTAAVLSRIYPQIINKSSILTENFQMAHLASNWEKSKHILNELGAFVPTQFESLSHNLFLCFISDLYYATRSGANKFIRIERPPETIISSRKPKNESMLSEVKPSVKTVTFEEYFREKQSKKSQWRPQTTPTVIRPSKTAPNLKKKEPITVKQSRAIATATTKKRKPLLANSSTLSNSNIFDDKTELLKLFTYIRRGERQNKFAKVDDPLKMISPLCTILNSRNEDQNFEVFWSMIENETESQIHFKNCYEFLYSLGGNNNEFAASRRIVYFARQMLQTYQGEPFGETQQPKRFINKNKYARPQIKTSQDKRVIVLDNPKDSHI